MNNREVSEQINPEPKMQPEQNKASIPVLPSYTQWPFIADEAKRRQAETAGALNISVEKKVDLGNGVIMEFVLIPAGIFRMGSPDSEKDRDSDEGPLHQVQITKPFYLGKHEVTQDQYMAVIKTNPSRYVGGTLPVETITWNEANEFCRKIGGRLPTEAQWEYACRAGTETRLFYGDDLQYSQLGEYAWFSGNSDLKTHPAGQKKPNAWGLHDMPGNVWEWCSDWYANSYRNASVTDPTGPSSGEFRVVRGGCWNFDDWVCRSADRSWVAPVNSDSYFGFRVALDLN